MVIRESYIAQVRPFMKTGVVKVLTGIRRCGKSVLLAQIQDELERQGCPKNSCLALNFESLGLPFSTVQGAYQFISAFAKKRRRGKRIFLFLDEVQELPGWERLVNSCLINFEADIYITGSNAKLLSGELATHLGGRFVEIPVYPFSFAEAKLAGSANFGDYLRRGGMPFLYRYPMDAAAARQYLGDIYASVILKDIVARHSIRDVALLEKLLIYLLTHIGHTFSATSIVKYLKSEQRGLSVETLYNYIGYCKDACLLHLAGREDTASKQALKFQEKMFVCDHGFREAVCGKNEASVDQVLENIVYMELLRRGYSVSVGKVENREIDFVAQKGAERMYIQVCYLLASKETVEREFGALLAVQDNYPKLVLSMDPVRQSRDGIEHRSVEEFLLGE
jgi:predicted AAA+ superfamily ATPase